MHPATVLNARSFSFFAFVRRAFSPFSHKWQNEQFTPFVQPADLQKKVHGWQRPAVWPTEPTVGNSALPNSRLVVLSSVSRLRTLIRLGEFAEQSS
jgi:hypothetical protein